PCSYLHFYSFCADYNNGNPVSRQRFMHEVFHPSQKMIQECAAVTDRKAVSATSLATPEAHGKRREPVLFVDGHSTVVRWENVLWPPNSTGLGVNWFPLDWGDVP